MKCRFATFAIRIDESNARVNPGQTSGEMPFHSFFNWG